jgi:hypothetical protein
MGLSERDPRKNHVENEKIEGDVYNVEPNEHGDQKLVENKGDGIFIER